VALDRVLLIFVNLVYALIEDRMTSEICAESFGSAPNKRSVTVIF